VAYEIALASARPLDVIVVRNLGCRSSPNLAWERSGEDDTTVLNEEVVRLAGVRPDELATVEATERANVAATSAPLPR